jgi:hypothetical protein
VIEGLLSSLGYKASIVSESGNGVDIYLDLSIIDTQNAARVRSTLLRVINELDQNAARKNTRARQPFNSGVRMSADTINRANTD